jgi:hypothetical protein
MLSDKASNIPVARDIGGGIALADSTPVETHQSTCHICVVIAINDPCRKAIDNITFEIVAY